MSPDATTYLFGSDFNVARFGAADYDVTGTVFVLLNMAGTDLGFGCSASDFSGFTSGSIAFMSRGSCTFNEKAAFAQAAGAIALLVGNSAAGDAIPIAGLGIPVDISAQLTSIAVRNARFPAAVDGTLVVRLTGGTLSPVSGVPEPASWTTMIAGFGAIGGMLRRVRRRQERAGLLSA